MELPKLEMSLTAKGIYDTEFAGNKPGYDCLQVDRLLNAVIEDYDRVDAYIAEVNQTFRSLKTNEDYLDNRIMELTKENDRLARENTELKNLLGIDAKVTDSQLENVKRIAKLEQALKDEGVDPKKII